MESVPCMDCFEKTEKQKEMKSLADLLESTLDDIPHFRTLKHIYHHLVHTTEEESRKMMYRMETRDLVTIKAMADVRKEDTDCESGQNVSKLCKQILDLRYI